MPHRESAERKRARRKAQLARTKRDHAHARREEHIESALTDYLESTAQVNRKMEAARARAQQIIAAAEQAAADDRKAAQNAVSRLHALLTIAEIAELCDLAPRAVRDMLAAADQAVDTDAENGAPDDQVNGPVDSRPEPPEPKEAGDSNERH